MEPGAIVVYVVLALGVVAALISFIVDFIIPDKAESQNPAFTSIFNAQRGQSLRVPSPHFVLEANVTLDNVRRIMNRGTRVKTMMGARRARSSTRS
jgi:hypothetical protein